MRNVLSRALCWPILWIAAVAVCSSAVLAAPSVALVLQVDGKTNPAVESFTEIEAGAKIDLGSAVRLVFIDYNTCKTVTIVGGQLIFTEQRYLLRKGKIINTKRARCPKVVRLNLDTRVAGVVLRAGNSALRLKTRPHFVFTGGNRDRIQLLRFRKGDDLILKATPQDHHFAWPEAAADLPVNAEFVLEILTKDGETAKSVPFRTTGSGKAELTVVRVD